jgi:hypothetical protein
MSLSFAHIIKKPLRWVSRCAVEVKRKDVPVYVSKYAVITQVLLSKPFKSSVIATRDVAVIVDSIFGRNNAKHNLSNDG